MFPKIRFLHVVMAVLLVGCVHTLETPPSAWTPVLETAGSQPVALLGVTDLRLRRGGGKTHERERPMSPGPSDGYASRTPMPLDPWNRYQWPPPRTPPPEDLRLRATGELGTDEVVIPMLDAFTARLEQHLGDGALRDAREDPLAEDPDLGRAQAFLAHYPAYKAATWLEITQARAELPDTATLQSLLTLGACFTFGLVGLAFFVPIKLDTPVEFHVRAYLVTRENPAKPLAASEARKETIQARGSAGFDVDRFRADVADLLSRDAGAHLADQLAAGLLRR